MSRDIDYELITELVRKALPGSPVDKVLHDGYTLCLFFPNGYGVSVADVVSRIADTFNEPAPSEIFYEMAALYGDRFKSCLTYKTPVGPDVQPGLTVDDAAALAIKVAHMPPNARTLTRR